MLTRDSQRDEYGFSSTPARPISPSTFPAKSERTYDAQYSRIDTVDRGYERPTSRYSTDSRSRYNDAKPSYKAEPYTEGFKNDYSSRY